MAAAVANRRWILTSGLDAPEDIDDLPDGELEDLEEEVVDQASAAKTIAELENEIVTLRSLEQLADQVRRSGTDAKWTRLAELLQDGEAEMFDEAGKRRKLIIFSEHRDTLNYLTSRIRTLIGRPRRSWRSTAECTASCAERRKSRSCRTRTSSCSSQLTRPAKA